MQKLILSILMVIGTTIGGGMVVLPAVVGIYGYFSAIGLLFIVWFVNILIALIFLEANCYLPKGTSLISMTNQLLGKHTERITWVIFLGFLYTIMCVYISGITEIIGNFLELYSLVIPSWCISIVSVVTISAPLYFGMNYVANFNRCIVMIMFLSFLMLFVSIAPALSGKILISTTPHLPVMALPIVFTSFGFLVVIPSLRTYLDDDVKKLKIAIILGSFIPLFFYILWTTAVMGIIPLAGEGGLQAILNQPEPLKMMLKSLTTHTGNSWASVYTQIFILFAIVSSFIGISLGLYDFLADGLKVRKTPWGKIKLLAVTFLPPLIIALTQSRLFITALGFAGLMSTILFGLYPIALTSAGRYLFKLNTPYRSPINWLVLLLIAAFCMLIIIVELWSLKVI